MPRTPAPEAFGSGAFGSDGLMSVRRSLITLSVCPETDQPVLIRAELAPVMVQERAALRVWGLRLPRGFSTLDDRTC